MTTLALIGAGEGGERRVAALEKLASENGLVDIRLVNPRQDPEQIASDCAGAEVLVAPNHQSTNVYAGNISGLKLLQTFSAGTDQLDKHMLLCCKINNHSSKLAVSIQGDIIASNIISMMSVNFVMINVADEVAD